MAGIFGGNSFSTYGLNPYPMSYGVLPQTTPTVQPTPTPQSFTPQSNIIWVNNETEINNYPTGRGWQQLFGDKNKPMFYIRETDLNGITQPVKKLSYTFEDPKAAEVQPTPTDNSVTREEFNSLAASVNTMTEKLADLLK